jgi:hypothetical protein
MHPSINYNNLFNFRQSETKLSTSSFSRKEMLYDYRLGGTPPTPRVGFKRVKMAFQKAEQRFLFPSPGKEEHY